jgi:TonB family protein
MLMRATRPVLSLVVPALLWCVAVAEGQSRKVDGFVGLRADGSWQVVPIDSARLDSLTRAGVILEQNLDDRPDVISGPQMRYPDGPRRRCITGRVLVQLVVGVDGRPEPATVRIRKSLERQMDQEALDYVLQATFTPGKLHGVTVRSLVNLPVDFKIRGAC